MLIVKDASKGINPVQQKNGVGLMNISSRLVTKALLQKEKASTAVSVNPLVSSLTEREIEIIKLVSNGFTNKEMAEKLFISPRTADTHRTNLMRKLNLHNVAEIVRFAFQNKLVE